MPFGKPRKILKCQQIFGNILKRAALVLVVFVLVNPFIAITLANNSPSSRPNISMRAGTSTNWSGYAAVSSISSPADGFVNSVTGSWVVSTLTCNSSEDTYVATWVGIDGYKDGTVEQIGTEQDCVNGVQNNYAWVEFYPGPSRIIPTITVHTGDAFTASVKYVGGSLFAMSITDLTTGQSYSRTRNAVAQRQSAEWVVEAPSSSSQVLPLANFGTFNFSNAQFMDNSGTTYAIDGRGSGTYDAIALDDPNGGSARPSGLVDSSYPNGPSSFIVTYGALSVSISPTSVSLDINQPQLFTSNVSDGTPPYTHQWYQDSAPVSGATDPTWTFTAVSAGSYTVYVEVNDGAGTRAKSNTATVTVNIHDIALTSVTPSKTVVGQGYSLDTNVTAADLGSYLETFNVTVYANTTAIASQSVTLSGGNSAMLAFSWNTTGVAIGNYIISANATPVPGETNTTNNNCTGGLLAVSISGDINGDFKVSLVDVVILAQAYGSKPDSADWNPNADIDDTGIVGLSDLAVLAAHYGQQA